MEEVFLNLEQYQQASISFFNFIIMKKNTFRIYIVAIISAILFSNCTLDEQLYGIPTSDGFVKDEADATFVVNGVYSTFQTFESFKSSTAGLVLYSGDDFASAQISGFNVPGIWLNRLFTSSDPYVKNAFNSFYNAINRANYAKETVENSDIKNVEFKNQISGEMCFIRALSHYYLVRLFGAVPILVSATKPTDNFYKSRQSVDSVYAQIFRDLKIANAYCLVFNKQSESEFGRATKGSAQAILAQAYLTYANYCDLNGRSQEAQTNYQYAVNWSDSVIISKQYVLLSNYADLYDVSKEKNAYKEVIFGIQFARDATTSGAASKGSEWATYTQPRERWNVCGNLLPRGSGGGAVFLQPWFVEQYFTGQYVNDYRSEVSFLTTWNGYNTANQARKYCTFPAIVADEKDLLKVSQPYLNKYVDAKGLDSRNHENDLYIIRYSEIFLIKAEALNELGRTSEAYLSFNELRKRARLANGVSRTTPADLASSLSQGDFRLAVFNERGLELVGEGQRFFDLVRMRYPGTNKTMFQWRLDTFYPNLPLDQKTLPIWDSTNKVWKNGRVHMLNVKEWNDRYLLYPIPTSEFDANTNIGLQNPGW